ncbi:MAG: hypothetical protein HY559_00780 [Gammaproteobacteria bacterium]|nr:hypothetical protein [Gammaproteobacteria bacterium]
MCVWCGVGGVEVRSQEQLAYLAAKANLPERLVLDTAKETVNRFKEVWEKEQFHLPLSKKTIAAIHEHSQSIPIMKDKK